MRKIFLVQPKIFANDTAQVVSHMRFSNVPGSDDAQSTQFPLADENLKGSRFYANARGFDGCKLL